MKIQESAEDYLETILLLEKKNGMVRSIDIAHEMNFSKPSISRAMSLLREKGLIHMTERGNISLSESGKRIAEKVYERHTMIKQFLLHLGVEEEIASEDACRIEHVISAESFEKLKTHVDSIVN